MAVENHGSGEVSRLPAFDALVESVARDLRAHLDASRRSDPVLVGIHTGGVWIAERLRALLDLAEPLGTLNINFYRDDFTRIGLHPRVEPSHLPFAVDDRHLVLVDDVMFTGRTIRAAMNEIFDFGRPASITLAVLVDRSGRELPIQPDVVGERVSLEPGEYVKLTGPQPLRLSIEQRA